MFKPLVGGAIIQGLARPRTWRPGMGGVGPPQAATLPKLSDGRKGGAMQKAADGGCRWCQPSPPVLILFLVTPGCGEGAWNNPWPAREAGANVLYSSFEERPKHLDPARSYSSNEYAFLAQIYEPPLQYHFLLRPYQLIPLTAREPAGAGLFRRRGPGAAPGCPGGGDRPVRVPDPHSGPASTISPTRPLPRTPPAVTAITT